jgi:hypothetical protein
MKENARNERIKAMKREIERRGGTVVTMDSLPDELVEVFLRQVLDCPECRMEADDPFRPKPQAHDH